jgi:hypothetical protein
MAKDIALTQFLALLQWLRRVLLQDAALLYTCNPLCAVLRYPPFNTPLFQAFAATSSDIIASAEEESCLALQNLPAHLMSSVRGLLTGIAMEKEKEREADARAAISPSTQGKMVTRRSRGGSVPRDTSQQQAGRHGGGGGGGGVQNHSPRMSRARKWFSGFRPLNIAAPSKASTGNARS